MKPSQNTSKPFPQNFLWGTASSSHQTEGNNHNNQWWLYEQTPNAIWTKHPHDLENSGLACDWWRNAERDFDHMQHMGIQCHRLSIEWSRIEPRPGVFDHAAIDRYRQMLGGLRDRDIRPMVAFHHFTDPQWFAQKGGWENAGCVTRFQHYVRTMVLALGDLCDFWLTFNEPLVGMGQGWMVGRWPPNKRNPLLANKVFRHFLFSHATAYQTIHACQPHAQVSYAKAVHLSTGLRTRHLPDRFAAGIRRYLFEHLWFMATVDGKLRPPLSAGHYHHALADSFDFVAINYYDRDWIRFAPNPTMLFGEEAYQPDAEFSDSGQHGPYSAYAPNGLHQICHEVSAFNKPIYITENGLPDHDDDQRPRWLVGHLQALHQAINEGCDVRGYFHWTLVDNFEWDQGWGLRFGLIEMDPHTQERQWRPSAYLYRDIIHANGLTDDIMRTYTER